MYVCSVVFFYVNTVFPLDKSKFSLALDSASITEKVTVVQRIMNAECKVKKDAKSMVLY